LRTEPARSCGAQGRPAAGDGSKKARWSRRGSKSVSQSGTNFRNLH